MAMAATAAMAYGIWWLVASEEDGADVISGPREQFSVPDKHDDWNRLRKGMEERGDGHGGGSRKPREPKGEPGDQE